MKLVRFASDQLVHQWNQGEEYVADLLAVLARSFLFHKFHLSISVIRLRRLGREFGQVEGFLSSLCKRHQMSTRLHYRCHSYVYSASDGAMNLIF